MIKTIAYIIIPMILLASCQSHVVKVDNIPANTPNGSPIYIAGNFNRWDASDMRFQLIPQKDSTYIVRLPKTIGEVTYKFTRGNWSTVEKDRCGNDIENRRILTSVNDTVHTVIESWADLDPINCDSVTIVIKDIPKETFEHEKIKIAGSFNAWNPGQDEVYELKPKGQDSMLMVTVPRIKGDKKAQNKVRYNFVRDTVSTIEADKFGREMDARVLDFEKGDTVFVDINNWSDRVDERLNYITIILTQIPDETPKNAALYLVGNFNNWKPRDYNYQFTKNIDGTYKISIPRKKYGLSFKITRGNWSTEFTDACGNILMNQEYNYEDIDTLYLKIGGWRDITPKAPKMVHIIVDKIPTNTPKNDVLYMACEGNGFDAGDKKFAFVRNENNKWEIRIPRSKVGNWYKITRGNWSSQEVHKNGHYIDNRYVGDLCNDKNFITIEKWNDIVEDGDEIIRVWVKNIPKETPKESSIYLTGEFNDWIPRDSLFKLKKQEDRYYIDVPLRWLSHGFKFTYDGSGTWEANKRGRQIGDRYYKGTAKEIKLEIQGWE